MTNEELAELEATKAQLRSTLSELEALKQRSTQSTEVDGLTRYAQMIILFAIMGLVGWQTYVTIQLRGLLF